MAEIKTELLQAILLNNLSSIKAFHAGESIQKDIDEENKLLNKFLPVSNWVNQKDAVIVSDKYNHLITLNDTNSSTSVGKMLALPDDVVEVYNKMTPLEKSFLYPKINIFKMNANGKYTEIRIKNNFDDLQLNLYDSQKKAEETIFGENEAFSVGLKSIHVQNKPERPGDINILVKITYLFENILALLQHQIRDLIRVPLDKDHSNLLDYRLKLVLGWSVPNDYSSNPAIDDIFKKAMEYSEEIYLLQIIQHDITFEDDGSVALSIQYGGAIEAYFESKSADILDVENLLLGQSGIQKDNNGRYKAIPEGQNLTPKTNISDKMKPYGLNLLAIQNLRDRLQKIEENPSSVNKEAENIQKQISELEETNLQYSKLLKGIRYGWILKQLYEQRMICAVEVDDTVLRLYNESTFNSEVDEESIARNKVIKSQLEFFFQYGKAVSEPKRIGTGVNEEIDVLNDLVNETDKGDIEDRLKKITEESLKSEDLMMEDSSKEYLRGLGGYKQTLDGTYAPQKIVNEEYLKGLGGHKQNLGGAWEQKQKILDLTKRPIYYIRLGDLFDVVFSFVEKREEYNLLFGTLEFYDYRTQKTSTINITDIPIALDHFSSWFINTVIKPQLDAYYFKNFIEDVIKTLVSPLFGFFYEGIKTPLSVVTFNSQVITSTVKIEEKTISTERLKGLLVDKNKKDKKFYQYYVIYCTVLENKDLKGDIKEDTEKGIYHYKIGSSSGMLTSIKFSKVDNNKLRDARITSQNLNTAGQILREHYDCDMSFIGNPLFQNGRLFYLDGSHLGPLGQKATESIGLGGYYLTHGIEHVFEDGNWTMDIHGYFQSTRYGAEGNMAGGQVGKPKQNSF